MKHYRLWVRITPYQTNHTIITDLDALIAEHRIGKIGKGVKSGNWKAIAAIRKGKCEQRAY